MIFTIAELFDLIAMTAIVGLIFMNLFRESIKPKEHEPLAYYKTGHSFDWNSFKFSIMAVAPAIALHELGHKFVAIGYGLQATFHAAYFWLFIGLALSLMNFRFIFFVPAYVAITGEAGPLPYALTSAAGPFMNLLLWIGAVIALKSKKLKKKHFPLIHITKQINMFLFFFNLLPFGPFDGAKFFGGMIEYLSSAL